LNALKWVAIIAMLIVLAACDSKSHDGIVDEISGVWRASDGSMVMINNDAGKVSFFIDDSSIAAIVGDTDTTNKIVNFNITRQDGTTGIWTVRQVWDKEQTSFHLQLTLHDGTQDELSFVRKISTEDLNKMANANGGDKSKTAIASAVAPTATPPVSPAPPARSQPTGPTQESSPAVEGTAVETTGVCKGLDLAVTPDQLDCLGKKFENADKQLNDTYKSLMSRLDASEKVALKKEQIAWIKEKETKCVQAGKDFEGGTMEEVAVADCRVQMTDKRLAELKIMSDQRK